MPPWRLRELTRAALDEHAADVLDPLPAELELPLRRDALGVLHFPEDAEDAEAGRRRLAFDELTALRLAVLRRATRTRSRRRSAARRARRPLPRGAAVRADRAPGAGDREIDRDLGATGPMQRLLQGDVGSGKTVVALYALLRAVEAGHQVR